MGDSQQWRPRSRTLSQASRGLFITFEGIEGSGKTTHCHRVAGMLKRQGYSVLETREPGGTPFAEQIRQVLLATPGGSVERDPPTALTEAFLIMACRSQHIAHTIAPALRQGSIVLCDRFFDSTLAYQGYGRGMSLHVLSKLNSLASLGLRPDLTLLFDLPVKKGLQRRRQSRSQNRIDQEALAFHERVQTGFKALAKKQPRRITVVQSDKTVSEVASEVDQHVLALVKKWQTGLHGRSRAMRFRRLQ